MRVWQRSAIGALLILALIRIVGISEGLDTWITDAHWIRKASIKPTSFPSDIIVVGIDDKTVRKFGRLRYWSRGRYARLLERMRLARVVAVDILFVDRDFRDPEGDNALIKAFHEHDNIVLPCYEWTDTPPIDNEILKVREKQISKLPSGNVFSIPAVNPLMIEPPFPELYDPRKVGSASLNADSDGVYRKPVVIKKTYNGRYLPSLSLATVCVANGLAVENVVASDRLVLLDRTVPIESGAMMMEPIAVRGGSYTKRAGAAARTISFIDALNMPETEFANKVVLVGETATGTTDIRPNPLDNGLRGVELNAQIIANMLYLDPVAPLPMWGQWLLVIAALALPISIYETMPSKKASVGASIGFVAIFVIMETIFWQWRLVPSWSPVLFAFVVSSVLMTVQRYAQEEALKRYLRQSFSMYVSPKLVEQIVRDPDIAKREGTRREVAVLFSDVRDFTPFCEQHSPEFVVKQLREFLNEMTAAVDESGGVLDKFIGDAVMALFGPFIPDEQNKSAAAIMCALDMQARLAKLNEAWVECGMPRFRVGIGIHTGEAIVGNVGAERRMQYTALGDSVNLAARLESATKELRVDILVSSAVKEQAFPDLGDMVDFHHIGHVSVKGRENTVEVYEVRLKPKTMEVKD